MKRHDGGYVLIYVVVVIVILCLLIPAACSNSLKNLKAQQASIERTRQLYEAEGQIERFTAEIKAGAETIQGKDIDTAKAGFAEKIFDIAEKMPNSQLKDGETREAFQPTWEAQGEKYQCGLSLVSTVESVTVNADIQVELEIKKDSESGEEAPYKITSCTITYKSYDISTTAETENAGEEGG